LVDTVQGGTVPADMLDQIIQGDCLEVMKQLPDGCVDAVITDPPYASLDVEVANGTTTRLVSRDRFAGKRLSSSTGKRWFSTIATEALPVMFESIRRLLVHDGALYVFADVKTGLDFFPVLRPANVIVWDKLKIGMGYSWRRMHEWIAYCPMPKHRLRDAGAGDIIRCPGVTEKLHPTQKPEGVVAAIIENSTDPGDIILDPFCGSGTTCVAAKRLGRHWIGIELDERYCEIARNRLAGTEKPLFAEAQ
jgi:site-specific DNA-methyltransferase (adenine-specific)